MLLALIMLTQLDGSPIYIEHSAIYVVNPSEAGKHRQCPPDAGTVIVVGTRGLCLRESVDEVCDKIERVGGKCDR